MNTGIIYYIASPFWGGGEEYVLRLSQSLCSRGYKVAFALQPNSDSLLKQRFNEVGNTLELSPKTKNGKFSFASAWQLYRFAKSHSARIIHVNALKDYFIAVWATLFSCGRIKIVATNHLVERAKTKPSWRWAYSHISTLINVSECAKAEFLSSPKLHDTFRRIYVVKNSVPDLKLPIYKSPSSIIKVLYHGRIHQEKGIIELVNHWHKANAHLLIAGSGEQIEPQPNLSILGFRSDARTLLNECDISISPSIVRESGGPLSLIEALAAGIPVIASNNGSQPEYMRNGVDGILCNPGDWDAFITAVNSLAADKELRLKMGSNGRAQYETELYFDHFIDTIERIYEEIL